MIKTSTFLLTVGVVSAICGWKQPEAADLSADAPNFTGDGQLQRPADYREWVFVTSGLGMTYGPAQNANDPPRFDNVFVNRSSHRQFLRSGIWPDKTIFILEVRRAESNVSINNAGKTQGELVALEAAVKDVRRFPSGWGYFTFDGPKGLLERAAPLPSTATCYACHETHGAVDNTFVQFYPTLFESAKRHRTVKPTYDPARKP